MGRLWLLAIEYNCKELDIQYKEKFIHGLNDIEMLREIIWELTKIHENEEITCKNVLSWVKRVKVQRTQSAIMNSLTEEKEFNNLKEVKNTHKDSPTRPTQT